MNATTQNSFIKTGEPVADCPSCKGKGIVMVTAPFGGNVSWSKPMTCGCVWRSTSITTTTTNGDAFIPAQIK